MTWAGCSFLGGRETTDNQEFDGGRALNDIAFQTGLGPRTPGSSAHAKTVEWIQSELENYDWQTEVQEAVMMGQPIQNVIARRGRGEEWIILGAHFDSRFVADNDPDVSKRSTPVPGANDGASGVAVLMELGRVIPPDLDKEIWLVFFDAEDNGGYPGWDWILGSRAFVQNLEDSPDAMVVVDMVGDKDLSIYLERNSDLELSGQIWSQAARLGYSDYFIPLPKYNMLDDHTPFLEAGITAALLIDFDYPYWHTTEDTLDKVAAESLQVVGETLFAWLTEGR